MLWCVTEMYLQINSLLLLLVGGDLFFRLALISIVIALIFASGIEGESIVSSVYSLAVLIPTIALSVRRLHDTDRSGWLMLLLFIPIIGWLVLLYFFVQDSQSITNEYGENPKLPTGSEF